MNTTELEATVRAMTARGKGLLAADESSGTIKKRFDSIGVESTETGRCCSPQKAWSERYRE
jgi:fructose-bisphosphate aldolase, class I